MISAFDIDLLNRINALKLLYPRYTESQYIMYIMVRNLSPHIKTLCLIIQIKSMYHLVGQY